MPLYREEPPEIESGSTETGCRSSLLSSPLKPRLCRWQVEGTGHERSRSGTVNFIKAGSFACYLSLDQLDRHSEWKLFETRVVPRRFRPFPGQGDVFFAFDGNTSAVN
ncbi:hypothetical protein SAMN03159341_103392 [Paenibacillus sp. 1_12]|uniref:hypothetical protein n=1 Tax=Paenibacillus sp. 1_12 TaxID=1566278 RepID=UPI0008E3CB57|nr:hypothetical protein [Paenibacillus sp. 1_12]SFL13093.1 hypothetical protein SAMN03159341_103392 [Paenibacillus sp. 1_12]